jgi:hypothetical protein
VKPESSCMGESQQGQVPFYRTRPGLMPSRANPGLVVLRDFPG